MTLEAGKPWREADGDVAEAVDFLEYYGREMLRLGAPTAHGPRARASTTVYFYEPRGVALVIAPWNFPLAILTGMTSAALVAGNPVIVKPAGPTPVDRRAPGAHPRGGRRAARDRQLPARPGRRGRRLPGAPPRRGPHRLHRLHGGRAAHHQPGGAAPGRGRRQEGHRRDGRQERDHRRRRRRPRRGRRGDRRLGLRLRRAEVLGRLAGDRARGGLRRLRAAARRRPRAACASARRRTRRRACRRSSPPRRGTRSRATSRKGAEEATLAAAAEPPEGGGLGGGFYVAPHVFTDVRPDAVIAQEEIFGPVLAVMKARRPRRGARHRQRRPVRAHRRPHQPQPGDHRPRAAASSASATSTSTAASPAPSSSASRSAASR